MVGVAACGACPDDQSVPWAKTQIDSVGKHLYQNPHIFICSLGNSSRNAGFWWILDIYLGLQNSLQNRSVDVYGQWFRQLVRLPHDACAKAFFRLGRQHFLHLTCQHRSCWHKLQLITRPCSTRDGVHMDQIRVHPSCHHEYGCVWKWLVPRKTQWFCWSLSLLNGYFIGNIPNIFRQTHIWMRKNREWTSCRSNMIWHDLTQKFTDVHTHGTKRVEWHLSSHAHLQDWEGPTASGVPYHTTQRAVRSLDIWWFWCRFGEEPHKTTMINHVWLVVWNMNFIFPYILGMSPSQLTFIQYFSRWLKPPTRCSIM